MIMCQNHVYHILNATLAVMLRVNEQAQHLSEQQFQIFSKKMLANVSAEV